MRLDPHTSARLLGAAALIAPLAAVQVTRIITEWGPSTAAAAPTQAPADAQYAEDPIQKPLTEAQKRALEFLESQRSNAPAADDTPSPMRAIEPISRGPALAPAPVAPARPEHSPKLALTGIMAGEAHQLASINGKIVSVGDEAAPGWKVTAIDATVRTVTVTNDAGRSVTLTPPNPRAR